MMIATMTHLLFFILTIAVVEGKLNQHERAGVASKDHYENTVPRDEMEELKQAMTQMNQMLTREREEREKIATQVHREIQILNTKMEEKDTELNELRKNSLLQNELLNSRHSGSVQGTFFAVLVGTIYGLGVGQPIIFESAIYNTGEYSTATGLFVCPLNGIYVFAATLHATNNYDLKAEITISGSAIAVLHSGVGTGDSHTCAGTVLGYCAQYQDVYVRYVAGTGHVYGGSHSYFSGFLLHAT